VIQIQVDGIEEAQELLARVAALGNNIVGAEVLGHRRKDEPDLNNAEVLEFLAMKPGNRDFFTMSPSEQKTVVENVFVKKLMQGLESTSKTTSRRITNKRMRSAGAIVSGDISKAMALQMKWAGQIMGNALRSAALSFLKWITNNIETQNWNGEGGDLSEEYAAIKKKKFGFTHPIGKATGQLIDNVAPSSKNIKLITGK